MVLYAVGAPTAVGGRHHPTLDSFDFDREEPRMGWGQTAGLDAAEHLSANGVRVRADPIKVDVSGLEPVANAARDMEAMRELGLTARAAERTKQMELLCSAQARADGDHKRADEIYNSAQKGGAHGFFKNLMSGNGGKPVTASSSTPPKQLPPS